MSSLGEWDLKSCMSFVERLSSLGDWNLESCISFVERFVIQ